MKEELAKIWQEIREWYSHSSCGNILHRHFSCDKQTMTVDDEN